MTARLRNLFSLLSAVLPLAAFAGAAQADPPKTGSGYTWPSHYDFFIPYGTRDGGPVYAKPGYKGVNLTLTCQEAKGLLRTRGYEDIEELSCTGQAYRFRVGGEGGRFVIELNPRTGDILKRLKL
jgi:hypothetical protein